MKVTTQNVIKIKLKGKDVVNLKSVLNKICQPKIGFNKAQISEDEMKTITNIHKKLDQ